MPVSAAGAAAVGRAPLALAARRTRLACDWASRALKVPGLRARDCARSGRCSPVARTERRRGSAPMRRPTSAPARWEGVPSAVRPTAASRREAGAASRRTSTAMTAPTPANPTTRSATPTARRAWRRGPRGDAPLQANAAPWKNSSSDTIRKRSVESSCRPINRAPQPSCLARMRPETERGETRLPTACVRMGVAAPSSVRPTAGGPGQTYEGECVSSICPGISSDIDASHGTVVSAARTERCSRRRARWATLRYFSRDQP
jgi:hypothetical protein